MYIHVWDARARNRTDSPISDNLPAIRRDLARKMTHRTLARRHNMRPSEVRDVAVILKIQGVMRDE